MRHELEVEVVSMETIRPSSPTPDHLRHYPLSFLDQLSPPVFMPLVFFFPKDDVSNEEKAKRVRESLSVALTRFYPLAGRVKGNTHIDCNDEGAYYVEARVNCTLRDILDNPEPSLMNKFLPFELDDVSELTVAVQVNFFQCGGLALGQLMSHKLSDALSNFTFLNSWAAIARGDPSHVIEPMFDSASYFPGVDLSGIRLGTGIVNDKILARRFIFSNSTLYNIRRKYIENGEETLNPRPPSRVEALSAFLWGRYRASTQMKIEGNKAYSVLHAVNLRTRMDPPLSDRHFGNISRIAITSPNSYVGEGGDRQIVNQVRATIKKIDGEYVKKLQEAAAHLSLMKERTEKIMQEEVVSFSFTSLCRFPMYEADFGWGEPVWIGSAKLKFKNLIVFMDTKSGDGIEAWVHLKEEDMVKFEKDEELLAHVSGETKICF